MFNKIKYIYYDYGFEILIGISVIFIILLSIYSYSSGNKGSYSSTYFYDKTLENSKNRGHFLKVLDNFSFTEKNESPQPIKKDSSGETECRRVLQKIFKRPFHKARPDFLRNPVTGGNFNLEIDCFCSELKLGLEYNGRQHYEFIPYFHKNKETFYNQQYRDYMKRNMCSQNGINLIEVPYNIKIEYIENFILKKLRELNYI